ncbi:MAG: SCP2 domain-containing protein [Gammaproteobacteria bacterium]
MSFMKIEAQQACLALLEQAINRYIELDPDYSQKLAPLYGSIIEIELSGLGLKLYLRTDSKGIMCQGDLDAEPDCVIKGTPIGLMKMTMGEKGTHTKGLFSGEVEIAGDIQLGQKMKQVLDSIEIDWEEHLSHITGDVIAYRAGQLVKHGLGWLQDSNQQMRDNLRDFFIYESEDVPHPGEVDNFVTQIDTLRDDVARAEARLQKLFQKIEDNPVK